MKIHVPPGQSRVIALPDAPAGLGSEVELVGDEQPFDNRLWLPYRQPQRCSVMYVGVEKADDVNMLAFIGSVRWLRIRGMKSQLPPRHFYSPKVDLFPGRQRERMFRCWHS